MLPLLGRRDAPVGVARVVLAFAHLIKSMHASLVIQVSRVHREMGALKKKKKISINKIKRKQVPDT